MDEVSSTEQLSPAAFVSRIDDWKGRDVRWEALGNGITNFNYRVYLDGGYAEPGGSEYVLRIPGAGTDMFIDRDREHHNHIAAAEAGVTPPILYTLEPEMSTVVPFIDGVTMHPETLAGNRELLGKVADAVRTYHDKATFVNDIDVFAMIRRYLDMAHDAGAKLPPDIGPMLELSGEIEAAMERNAPPLAACHNDLLAENFILDRGGKMWVIDWEYGGNADPYFDLGDFCVEHPLSEDEERFILTRYCGGFDESRYARMLLHKLVADLWWSIWAMIQVRVSKLDFDFFEYGMNRVARFHANAAKPGLKTWLAAV